MESLSFWIGSAGLTTTLAALVTAFLLIWWFLSKRYSYWSDRDLPGPKPVWILGNMLQRIASEGPQLELDWQNLYGKLYGFFTGLEPTLCVLEPALIKQIMVKDFDHYVNRRLLHAYHPIWNQNLFLLSGQRWKRVRTITSPSFTSGKLRTMRPLMNGCVDKLVAYLDGQVRQSNSATSVATIDTKAVVSGFTIDVIASTSFGTETDANSATTGDSRASGFVVHASNLFNLHPFKVLATMALPHWFNRLVQIKYVFPPSSFRFFHDLVKQILSRRKASPSTDGRLDLVQMLLDARIDERQLATTSYQNLTATIEPESESLSNSVDSVEQSSDKSSLSQPEIIAQCILFFVAGFETTASTISHLIYEMAMNPDVQERLCEELNAALADFDEAQQDSEQYFETVMSNIPYLEAAIKETLRKYPPVARVNRRLGTDRYRLGELELEKNQMIEVPVYALHHNPQYFPEPEQFRPDRFMPDQKHLLVPYSYMPFGVGPRNCIGMRFAYQEIKLVLARILPRYRFSAVSGTPDRIKYRQTVFVLSSVTFPVGVSRR